jgi:hypothetical protein
LTRLSRRNVVLTFTNAAEQTAWALAESLSERALSAMKVAEEAAETFRSGRVATRQRFRMRGLSEVDADTRWAGTSQAKKSLAMNDWFMTQSMMYSQAATMQYAKALYLKTH